MIPTNPTPSLSGTPSGNPTGAPTGIPVAGAAAPATSSWTAPTNPAPPAGATPQPTIPQPVIPPTSPSTGYNPAAYRPTPQPTSSSSTPNSWKKFKLWFGDNWVKLLFYSITAILIIWGYLFLPRMKAERFLGADSGRYSDRHTELEWNVVPLGSKPPKQLTAQKEHVTGSTGGVEIYDNHGEISVTVNNYGAGAKIPGPQVPVKIRITPEAPDSEENLIANPAIKLEPGFKMMLLERVVPPGNGVRYFLPLGLIPSIKVCAEDNQYEAWVNTASREKPEWVPINYGSEKVATKEQVYYESCWIRSKTTDDYRVVFKLEASTLPQKK